MKNSNLLAIEPDFRTPMMNRMFLTHGKYPKSDKKPLAAMKLQFTANPKWRVCYGGR